MLRGVSIFLLRDVVRTFVFFSFLLLEIHCSYIVIANLVLMILYIWWGCYYSSFTYLYMCCFFSLFMHMLFINCMQSFIFLFHTKMPWWILFKVFQKYRLSKSSCHKLSSCKVFREFVLISIEIYENQFFRSNFTPIRK